MFLRNYKIIILELFVFASFLAICAILDALIGVIQETNNTSIEVLLGILSVGIGLVLISAWLLLWYYLTKKLMKTSRKEKVENPN